MDITKQTRLEAAGWNVGNAADFLELTLEEATIVEMRVMLSRRLKERRKGLMTQAELATKMSSSQPRIAMAENGDSSVSIDYCECGLMGRSRLDDGIPIAVPRCFWVGRSGSFGNSMALSGWVDRV
jgi:Helix-turn-helix